MFVIYIYIYMFIFMYIHIIHVYLGMPWWGSGEERCRGLIRRFEHPGPE